MDILPSCSIAFKSAKKQLKSGKFLIHSEVIVREAVTAGFY